jgi:translation initiation factor IF-2
MGGSTFQILALIAFIIIPVIGSIVKKLAEHREQKQVTLERARMRDEMLRTGRTGGGGASEARPAPRATPAAQGGSAARTNLEEITRRRQAQLEELRRRQAARAQTGTRPAPVASAPAPMRRPTPPTPPPAPMRRPQPTPARPPAPPTAQTRPAPRPRPVVAEPVAKPAKKRRRERPRQVEAPPVLGTLKVASSAIGSVEQAEARSRAKVKRDLDQWRRAIVLSELLAPPVSMRQEHL